MSVRHRTGGALVRAAQPFVRFVHIEAAGGIVLLAATIAALVWANSPWSASYETLWSTTIRVPVGSYVFEEELLDVVNDLLMAVFFFVVGMEIKREVVAGELRDRRTLALPVLAAVGGMAVPALIYTAFNSGGEGADGWGIPMATDIAFAVGVLALLGRRVPGAVKLLLLTLAIVDDVGAIAVIAIFYADDIRPDLLLVAAGIVVVIAVLQRAHVTVAPLFAALAAALWLAVYESGVHATIAGVLVGLLVPAHPRRRAVSACDRLIDAFHPWTSFVILPIFALANAGLTLSAEAFEPSSPVFAGVVVGLVVGKVSGIVAFSWLAVRLGLGRLPNGTSWRHVVGLGAVAGIGFTVALFITSVAFESPTLQDKAKAGTFVASAAAAMIGTVVFLVAGRADRQPPRRAGEPSAA